MTDEPSTEEQRAMNATDHELRALYRSGNEVEALAAEREAEMRGIRITEGY